MRWKFKSVQIIQTFMGVLMIRWEVGCHPSSHTYRRTFLPPCRLSVTYQRTYARLRAKLRPVLWRLGKQSLRTADLLHHRNILPPSQYTPSVPISVLILAVRSCLFCSFTRLVSFPRIADRWGCIWSADAAFTLWVRTLVLHGLGVAERLGVGGRRVCVALCRSPLGQVQRLARQVSCPPLVRSPDEERGWTVVSFAFIPSSAPAFFPFPSLRSSLLLRVLVPASRCCRASSPSVGPACIWLPSAGGAMALLRRLRWLPFARRVLFFHAVLH